MKLKYKKLVLFISVGTICIGGIAYTIVNRDKGSSKGTIQKVSELSVSDSNFSSGTYQSSAGELTLEKNAYPEINTLVTKYFEARANCDMDTLGTLVSDIDNISEDELKSLSEYVEGYQDIDCYTVKGLEDDSYVVLVYSGIKMKDIDTLAPGLTGLYVNKDSNGNYVIYNGVTSDEQTAYKEAVYNCKGVQELITMIEENYQEALESDAALKELYSNLQEQAESAPEEAETETKEDTGGVKELPVTTQEASAEPIEE